MRVVLLIFTQTGTFYGTKKSCRLPFWLFFQSQDLYEELSVELEFHIIKKQLLNQKLSYCNDPVIGAACRPSSAAGVEFGEEAAVDASSFDVRFP